MAGTTDPEHIAVSKSKGIKIDWKDGHHSKYTLEYLRDKCPCAVCTGAHGTPPREPASANPFQMYRPAMRILNVEPVGSYAVRFSFSDGHNSGIYSYDHLRRICPCAECQTLFAEARLTRPE